MSLDPKEAARQLLGPIAWTDELTGFCHCPGQALHTAPTHPRDTRVSLDGAPTIYCFHQHCQGQVAQANWRLRRLLDGGGQWRLTLNRGQVLAAGEQCPAAGEGPGRRAPAVPELPPPPARDAQLHTLEAASARWLPALLRQFAWPYQAIVAGSPVPTEGLAPREMFALWLQLWPPEARIWIGELHDTGQPHHAAHFRSVPEWARVGPGSSPFTCPSSFQADTYQRANKTVATRQFLVVESDTLSREEIGAVFRYLQERRHYRLHCIIDTAGKSLHGWFSPPADAEQAAQLRAALTGFGCDPKLFSPSQPVRLPGGLRAGRTQKLLWIRQNVPRG